jgi:hypothetical protein
MVRDHSNFDELGNPLSDIKLFEFEEVKELIKENKRLTAKVHKLERKLEYVEWKRITDKKKGD